MAVAAPIGMRKQVQLVSYVQTRQSTGNVTESVGNTYNLWAEVKRISGGRTYNGQTQLEEAIYFRVRFNFSFNPDAKYKITYNGHRHTVKSIEQEDEKQFYWIIKADTAHG